MSATRVFRLTVAYDGTAFHGWQRQPGLRTVQGELEAALSQVLDGDVKVNGAGRTDTGVHARGQVASFEWDTPLPGTALAPMSNRLLPADVRVVASAEAPSGFHARHSARARRYEYRLLARPDLLRERFAWAPPALPAREALTAATAPLLGRHDFTAFQATGNDAAVPECDVVRLGWRDTEDGVALDVAADHFLYHMVRKMVGTALEACATSDPGAHVKAVLESRDRARVGRMAPPRGLSLEQVYYDGEVLP